MSTNDTPAMTDTHATETDAPIAAPETEAETEAAPDAGDVAVAVATAPAPARRPMPGNGQWFWGLGRRKSAVARVRIRPGEGKFQVNDRPFEEYFTGERDRKDIMTVLDKTSTRGMLDVFVNAHGGGFTGQAGAVILGLGRALKNYDPGLDSILRDNNFLTRDAREVERKKYGQPGARKRFQFSKR
jgi:small subunit ribosomal protein S9